MMIIKVMTVMSEPKVEQAKKQSKERKKKEKRCMQLAKQCQASGNCV